MNKHEFETLTGLQVGADEYEAIEKVYTATEDDKVMLANILQEYID